MTLRKRIENYIKDWENKCYSTGIPDEAPAEISHLIPSYKRIAIAILKNDNSLKSLGFTPKNTESYNMLKRIELSKRPGYIFKQKYSNGKKTI
jgi:predicted phosphoadenosine phosphosulfate sulfurtransferase